MLKRAQAIGLAFFVLLAQPAVALAQVASPPTDWSAVQSLPSGDEVVVRSMDGKTVRGRLRSVTDTHLTLVRKNQAHEIPRQDVQRVQRVFPRSPAKPTLIGAAAGAGIVLAGIGVAVAADESGGDDGEVAAAAAALAILGAGAGALIGLAFGKKEKKVLIYQIR